VDWIAEIGYIRTSKQSHWIIKFLKTLIYFDISICRRRWSGFNKGGMLADCSGWSFSGCKEFTWTLWGAINGLFVSFSTHIFAVIDLNLLWNYNFIEVKLGDEEFLFNVRIECVFLGLKMKIWIFLFIHLRNSHQNLLKKNCVWIFSQLKNFKIFLFYSKVMDICKSSINEAEFLQNKILQF